MKSSLAEHWPGVLAAACVVLAAAVSTLLWPPGLLALTIAVGCAWPWSGRPASALAACGLSSGTRAVTAVVVLGIAAGANLLFGGQLDGHLMYRGDFQTYFIGAEVGLRHGWAHLFDQGLQRPLWTAAFDGRAPFIPYLNTPPQAWLVAPLTALGFPAAFALWVGLMLATTLVAGWLVAPPTRTGRAMVVGVGLALWVLAYSLAGGQNAVLGPLAIILCWRLLGAGRPGLAGIALALIAVRPNATLLVPVALLVAGQRRAFLGWLATSAVIGGTVLISLGPAGVRQFLELGAEIRRTHPGALTLTVGQVLGGGWPGVLAGVALAATCLVVAARIGPARPDLVILTGVLGSLFVTPYIHIQDYLALLGALAIVARTDRRNAVGVGVVVLLALAPPGATFGPAWPPLLLAAEVMALGWLGSADHPGVRHPPSGPATGQGEGRPAGRVLAGR